VFKIYGLPNISKASTSKCGKVDVKYKILSELISLIVINKLICLINSI